MKNIEKFRPLCGIRTQPKGNQQEYTMAINQTNRKSNSASSSNSDSTWWLELEGMKEGTSVAFNLSPAFAKATPEQVVRILNTQEVHISCFKKVAIKIRGEREGRSDKITFGYLNNYAHGLPLDCDPKEASKVSWSIKAELEGVTVKNISQLINEEEAQSILDNM